MSRYSATNLSSPESAYSTGYSTDGTSPGGAPPDYPIKPSDKKSTGKQEHLKKNMSCNCNFSEKNSLESRLNPELPSCSSRTKFQCFSEQASSSSTAPAQEKPKVFNIALLKIFNKTSSSNTGKSIFRRKRSSRRRNFISIFWKNSRTRCSNVS